MAASQASSRAAVTRGRLLDAAVEAFAVRGFHGTSTRDIAAAAGMSPAAVYVHHRSKEELLFEISRSGHERILSLVRDAVSSATDPPDQLAAVVRTFAAHHARDHTTARIVNYELASLDPAHLEEVRALRRAIERTVLDVVERGADLGVFDVLDPKMTTTALLSLGIDIARWYRDEGTWSPNGVAERYVGFALRIVGARH